MMQFPEFSSFEARLNSFHTWPKQIKQSIYDLAAAGLFYTGYDDATLCFHCGKGLHQWEITDIPRIEHYKYYPECTFIKLLMTANDVIVDHDLSSSSSTIKECLICTQVERQIFFQPCGHVATCFGCSLKIKYCCCCRKYIMKRLRAYVP